MYIVLKILQEGLFSKYQEYKHPRDKDGKWANKYGAGTKVIGKNVLSDAIATAGAAASAGWARHAGMKVGLKSGLLGAGLGSAWGAGEGLIKYKLLKNKNKEQIEKTVSHPAYKYSNIAGLALNTGLTQAIANKIEDPEHYKKLIQAAKESKNVSVLSRIGRRFAGGKFGKAALIGGTIGAAIAADVGSDAATEAAQSKIYGPERSSVTGTEELYTKHALKKGMWSGKKYKYGGLGPEIKQRKQNKSK